MTIVDLVALVAGVALGFAAIGREYGASVFFVFWPTWAIVVSYVLWFMELMTLALSIVALGRVTSYRRMPRPAEWLAILVAVWTLSGLANFNEDAWIFDLFESYPGATAGLEWGFSRWLVAGLVSAVMLATFAVLRLGRRAYPAWLKTLLLAWQAVLALAGPLWTFGLAGQELLSPLEGFGAGDREILHRQACELFGLFPTGLFFGVPAIAVALERLAGRRWAWDEWAGVATSAIVGFALMLFYRGEIPRASPFWLVERAYILAWFLAIALTSRLIVAKLGTPWRRWIDGPADQDRSSSSAKNSDASTC